MTVSQSRSWTNYFLQFRKNSHWLFSEGYAAARYQINSTCLENHITGTIVVAINKLLDAPTTPVIIRERYTVYEEEPLYDPTGIRVANSRRRTDIRLRYSKVTPRPIYMFEAKLLWGGTHGGKEALKAYLGSGGLEQVLTDPSYMFNVTEAAMVGYVQSRQVSDWEMEIVSEISGASRTTLQVLSNPRTILVVPALPHTLISEHLDGNGKKVPIFHILVDCT